MFNIFIFLQIILLAITRNVFPHGPATGAIYRSLLSTLFSKLCRNIFLAALTWWARTFFTCTLALRFLKKVNVKSHISCV